MKRLLAAAMTALTLLMLAACGSSPAEEAPQEPAASQVQEEPETPPEPTPEELAAAFHAKGEMGLSGGMLVTNPIPEEYSMDPDEINGVISRAVEEARSLGIHGKETTPFLLAKISLAAVWYAFPIAEVFSLAASIILYLRLYRNTLRTLDTRPASEIN